MATQAWPQQQQTRRVSRPEETRYQSLTGFWSSTRHEEHLFAVVAAKPVFPAPCMRRYYRARTGLHMHACDILLNNFFRR